MTDRWWCVDRRRGWAFLAISLVLSGCGVEQGARSKAGSNVGVAQVGVPLYTVRDAADPVGTNGEFIDATLAGSRYPDSTGMWVGCDGAAATASYLLDGRFERLVGSVGLQEHTPPGLTARVMVVADGRTIREYVAAEDAVAQLEIPVDGVDVLVVSAIAEGAECTVSDTPYGALGDALLVPEAPNA